MFRNTGLDDAHHVAFAARFGELDDMTPYTAGCRAHRLSDVRLFDVGNIDLDGTVFALDNVRREWNKVRLLWMEIAYHAGVPLINARQGNGLFHVDSSFNPRRAGYSLLRAHELRSPGMGGDTEFADVRASFDDLPTALKEELHEKYYIAAHSLWHSRKMAAPMTFAHVKSEDYPMGRHRRVQRHEASGREMLYVASHIHHIEGLDPETSKTLVDRLFQHANAVLLCAPH